jgi:hypothetical protein
MLLPKAHAIGTVLLALAGCEALSPAPPLSKALRELSRGQWQPRISEREAIGVVAFPISRQMAHFRGLKSNRSPDIVFKDEEATGADRMMTQRLEQRLTRLNGLVQSEWPGVRLRVTEAWDENLEHGPLSAHYEGRAADVTTSDVDPDKLGRLAYLAVRAGLDWVYYEDPTHVHVSVRR